MKVITKRDAIRGVFVRWERQYNPYSSSYVLGTGESIGTIRKKLQELDLEICSVEDIDRVLGRTGWADNLCNECRKDSEIIVRFGNKDSENLIDGWWDLCPDCLAKAITLLTTEISNVKL